MKRIKIQTIVIAVLVIIFVGLHALEAADADRCSVCNKKLPKSYYKSKDKYYCSEQCVLASKPSCVVCGKKNMKGGFYWNGKYVCSEACLDTVRPKCTVCGKTVVGGKGLSSEGKHYCSKACFTKSLPSCAMCGKKVQKMMKTQGRVYCDRCYATEKCLQCGLPAGKSVLPDSRPFCSECKVKGIVDPKKAQVIYFEVKQFLEKEFRIKTDNAIRFHLVDFNQFKEISENREMNENGLYKQVKTVTTTKVSVFGVDLAKDLNKKTEFEKDIYILNWLAEPDFRMVCAHELMHDWTQEHYSDIEDPRIVEGLSEYAGYLLCRTRKYNHLIEKMEHNKDEVYGVGFRLVRKADKGKGLSDIIRWLDSGRYKTDLKKADLVKKSEIKGKGK